MTNPPEKDHSSIFREYYTPRPFIDRYAQSSAGAVDVIIPVIHTNELWEENLKSFYREIPIQTLLIGDGGCTDDSIEIARKFPRVEVLDHRSYESLGFSIRKLIEASRADWFVYVHSDAYLPAGWFDAMQKHQGSYDWFGCPMIHTVMVEYELDYGERPWAGSQMGRKDAFTANLNMIDDDYVYRQEDFVWTELLAKGGFTEGRVRDTVHFHQTMRKISPSARKVKSIVFDVEVRPEEEIRTWMMQGKGIVKYLQPNGCWVVTDAIDSFGHLLDRGAMTRSECRDFILKTNPAWLPVIERGLRRKRIRRLLGTAVRTVGRKLLG